MWMPW